MDLSVFATPEAWISLITLIFLEIVLGVDNLVFISITTNRLPEEKQHIGRKLGLAGALLMRIVFLCFASYLVHMTAPLFTIDLGPYSHGFSIRDLVLLVGGAYLIYKGVSELREMLKLTEVKAAHSEEHKALHLITLPQAVGTIMVMDLVFSIDSVITAVGMADHLIIMIIAVMLAVILMMAFIDPISDFINGHPEMKMLALTFIVAIGALLVIDSAGFHTGIEASAHAAGEADGVLRHGVQHRAGTCPDALQQEPGRLAEGMLEGRSGGADGEDARGDAGRDAARRSREGIGRKNTEREEAPGLPGAFGASGRKILGQAPRRLRACGSLPFSAGLNAADGVQASPNSSRHSSDTTKRAAPGRMRAENGVMSRVASPSYCTSMGGSASTRTWRA